MDPAKGLGCASFPIGPRKTMLNYIALGLLIFVVIVNFYGIITMIRKLIRWSAARLGIR